MCNIARFFFAVSLCLPARAALAQSGFATAWGCWYDGETSVLCLLRSAGPPEGPAVPPANTSSRPLPAIVQAIRNDPAGVEGPIIIPLYAFPYDMGFVRELTQSVMCGLKSACKVLFGTSYAEATGQILANR